MCGIVGFYNKGYPTKDQWNYLNNALFIDTVRGSCGTGVAAIDNKNPQNFAIIKKAVPGPDFLQLPIWDSFEHEYSKYNIFLGHNRAATRGSAIDKNAHPFYAGPKILAPNVDNPYKEEIILVHNGTINNHNSLSPKGFFHDVDSAHIASGMAWKGELETLENLDGWFVLIWVNLTKKTFNLARSDCRDISLITSKDGKTLYFGSEALLINPCLTRNRLETDDVFKSPGAYEWFTWPLESPDFSSYTRQAIKKWKATTIMPIGRANHRDGRWQYGGSEGGWSPNHGYYRNHTDVRAEELKEYNITPGEDIEFMITRWEAYSLHNDSEGKMFGETYASPETSEVQEVVVYTVKKSDYDNFYSKDSVCYTCIGTPKRIDTIEGKKHIVVTIDHEKIRAKAIGEAIKDAPDSTKGPLKASIEEHLKQAEEKPALPAPKKLPGPRGDLLGLQEWRQATQDGCQQCGGNLFPEDAAYIWWIGEYCRDPICPGCAGQLQRTTKITVLPVDSSPDRFAAVIAHRDSAPAESCPIDARPVDESLKANVGT